MSDLQAAERDSAGGGPLVLVPQSRMRCRQGLVLLVQPCQPADRISRLHRWRKHMTDRSLEQTVAVPMCFLHGEIQTYGMTHDVDCP